MLNRWLVRILLVSLLAPMSAITKTNVQNIKDEFFWLVVVNAKADVSELTRKQVMSLFLGRSKFLPNGNKVKALDFPVASAVRAEFYQALTGKNIADIDAYWARLQYSGRATPPQPMESSEQIMQIVGEEDRAIAYLPGYYKSQLKTYGLKAVLKMKII